MGALPLVTSSFMRPAGRGTSGKASPWAHEWRDDDGWYVMNIKLMLPNGVVLSCLIILTTKVYVEYSAYCQLLAMFIIINYCESGFDGCVSATCVLLSTAALDSMHIIIAIIPFLLSFMVFPVIIIPLLQFLIFSFLIKRSNNWDCGLQFKIRIGDLNCLYLAHNIRATVL